MKNLNALLTLSLDGLLILLPILRGFGSPQINRLICFLCLDRIVDVRRFAIINRHIQALKKIKKALWILMLYHSHHYYTGREDYEDTSQSEPIFQSSLDTIRNTYYYIIFFASYSKLDIIYSHSINSIVYIHMMFLKIQTFCKARMKRTDGFLEGSGGAVSLTVIRSDSNGTLTWSVRPLPSPEIRKQISKTLT
jgi:hypothetical protein